MEKLNSILEIVSLSSSVVRVVDGELIILREGKISNDIRNYFNR